MKKIILAAAVLAMLASCTKDGGGSDNPFATSEIHLDPNTIRPSKASTATLLTMQSSPSGFLTWAADSKNATGWYDGIRLANHIYSGGAWNFVPPKQWPTDADFYPLNFYAFFPTYHASYTLSQDDDMKLVEAEITVPPGSANQVDMLAGRQIATARPASGNLSIVFHHILSKINFALDMNVGLTAYVQGLELSQIGNVGKYSIEGGFWSASPALFETNYDYYGRIIPGGTGGVEVIDTPALAGNATAMTPFYTASTTPTAADANLMLVPQNQISRTWGGSVAPTALPEIYESYITMIYRLTDGTGDVIGLTQAQDHPGFIGSDLADGGYLGTDPLFVKVGYPFVLAWEPGKGYMYNINLDSSATGATGGYLLDDYYYDNKGNRTDMRIDAVTPGVNIPDPILGDGDIHLIPNPSDWDDDPTGIN